MATNIDAPLSTPSWYDEINAAGDESADEPTYEVELPDEEDDGLGGEGEEDTSFDANLAENASTQTLLITADLVDDIDNDRNSRKDWERTYIDGLKLLGLKPEERTEPWMGACGVVHPMITEAVVRFQSETITETFPAQGPVRTKIIGKETPDKKKAAQRVEEDMNYQLTERMVEYRAEHEKMLWSLPATGSAFKKVYYDPGLGRQVSMFVPAEDLLLPYGTSDISSCHRVTHVMRKTKNEIIKLQKAGFYVDIDLPDPEKTKDDIQKAKDKETGFTDIQDDRYTLYECHVDLDLPGYEDKDEDSNETGIALPYVVTILKGSLDVLAIRRNWKEDDPLKLKRQHFVHYQYVPGFGAYGFGLFHLIGGYAQSATSITRQLVDAGTLSNLPGGLKSRGLRIKGDDTPIAPGEFRDVDVGSGTIRDSILPLPYKEPSQTLFQLLGAIVEEGRRFAATADVKVSDMSAQAPVGTTLALLERQLKVLTAVQARVHFSLKQELGLIAEIIRDYTSDEYNYEPETDAPKAKKSDYSHVDILPVSDPNAATMSQRIIQYQAVIQLSQSAPQIYDMPLLHRGMLEVLGIKNADKLVPMPDDMKPQDPITENMNLLKGDPVKAFIHQDHEAHIAAHNAMQQDPIIAQMMGQNPNAQQIAAALAAHLADHVGFAYRQKIEAQLGIPLPPPGEDLPPEVEVALSSLVSQAAQQVLQQSQQQAAAQQAQQQAQDPVLQMQMKELEIKGKETDAKVEKSKADILLDIKKLEFEREKALAELEAKGVQMGATLRQAEKRHELEVHKVDVEHERSGLQIGVDIAKHQESEKTKRQQKQQVPKPAKKE